MKKIYLVVVVMSVVEFCLMCAIALRADVGFMELATMKTVARNFSLAVGVGLIITGRLAFKKDVWVIGWFYGILALAQYLVWPPSG